MISATDRVAILRQLDERLCKVGDRVAVFLVYERPSQVRDRPELARTYFAQRCTSDRQINDMIDAYREIGAYVELFEGEQPFLTALTSGRLNSLGRRLPIMYNGVGFGITTGGFEPGRMALLPTIADSYGLLCANSDAYTCAFALHRFHSFVVLRALGVQAPPVWHYNTQQGWMGHAPPIGTKVIAKNTYEAWSVGVTDRSVFTVDETVPERVSSIIERIGQPVTLQEFISGREICVPIIGIPERIVMPPVEQILNKSPDDPDAFMTISDNLNMSGVTYTPFEGPDEAIRQMSSTAETVFAILQQRALGRMDYRIDCDGRPWLTDVAVTPGLGRDGSMFTSIASLGFDYEQFLRIALAASFATRGSI